MMRHCVQTTLIALCLFFVVARTNCQALQLSATMHYRQTLQDITKPNNPWGAGAGLLATLGKQRWQPIAELSIVYYLADDKVARLDPGGAVTDRISNTVSLMAGVRYRPHNLFFATFTAGPCKVNNTNLAIEPGIGTYFNQRQQSFLRLYYLYVFDRDKISRQQFSSAGLSIGIKL